MKSGLRSVTYMYYEAKVTGLISFINTWHPIIFYQAKQAKLAEDAAEPSNKAITDQQCGDGESPMVELRIRMPDGQVLHWSIICH